MKIYKLFEENLIREKLDNMKLLGYIPLNTKEILENRLKSIDSSIENSNTWMNRIHTSDMIATYNGKIKLVLDPVEHYLQNNLTREEYQKLYGLELTKKEVDKYVNQRVPLTKKEVMENPIWNHIARDNKLLKEYFDTMNKFHKELYPYENKKTLGKIMDVSLDTETPKSTLLTLDSLWMDTYSGIRNDGEDYPYGGIIGVRK